MKCECDTTGNCDIHVMCDDNCKALHDPKTLEEYKKALEHCVGHGLSHGCSHGC